jgi:hypothetical protein
VDKYGDLGLNCSADIASSVTIKKSASTNCTKALNVLNQEGASVFDITEDVINAYGDINSNGITVIHSSGRVDSTEKVFNVLDFGARPLVPKTHSSSTSGSIIAPNMLIDLSSCINPLIANSGDYLWVSSGHFIGMYKINIGVRPLRWSLS